MPAERLGRRRCVTTIIFFVVVAVKQLPNPYRAILDAGVAGKGGLGILEAGEHTSGAPQFQLRAESSDAWECDP